jgi:hypothetical protein
MFRIGPAGAAVAASLSPGTAAGGLVAVLVPVAVYASVAAAYLRWGEAVWRRAEWVARGSAALVSGLVGAAVVGVAGTWSSVPAHAAVLVSVGVGVAAVPVVAATVGRRDVGTAVGLTVALPVGTAAAFVTAAVGVKEPLWTLLWTVTAAAPAVAVSAPVALGVAAGRGVTATARQVGGLGGTAVATGGLSVLGLATAGALGPPSRWVVRALPFGLVGVAMATLALGWPGYLVGRSLAATGDEGETDADCDPERDRETTATVRRS